MKIPPMKGGPAWRFTLAVVLLVACAVCGHNMLCPAEGLAQDATSVSGLGKGERDTMRVDLREEGREERIVDSRVSDQKIGFEERKIRLERRAEELLREEEVVRMKQETFAKEVEEARAEASRRQAEDLRQKKRAVDVSPDL